MKPVRNRASVPLCVCTQIMPIVPFSYSLMKALNFAAVKFVQGRKRLLFIQATMVIAPLFLSCVTNGPRAVYPRAALHPYIHRNYTAKHR